MMPPAGYTTEGRLRVARRKTCSRVLGPGSRAVIWFHGCDLGCPGCVARELNTSARYEVCSAAELAGWVLAIPGIEGITLTGGEPFQQSPGELGVFLDCVRRASELSVMCYTGYTLDALLASPEGEAHQRLLGYIDILVDGPYVAGRNEGHLWRGSANQRIHFLTDRYRSMSGTVERSKGRAIEVELIEGRRLELTGIPEAGFLDRFRRHLDRQGMILDFSEAASGSVIG
ncbi:MAG: radical SAM protein [Phycisphaerae bacterium]|nr:radical SAM protein [Phycisphaerae bacterium]